jgi:hypothetical protein
MHPEIFALPLQACAVLIGPPNSRTSVTGVIPVDISFFGSLIRDLLIRHADTERLRSAAIAWDIVGFDLRQSSEQRLYEEIARMVERGRLQVRFLPLFRDDPRGPSETGPLRIYQLGSGPSQAAVAPAPRPSSSPPPPPPTLSRSAPAMEKDFPNEPAQTSTLNRSSKAGAPFVEICKG